MKKLQFILSIFISLLQLNCGNNSDLGAENELIKYDKEFAEFSLNNNIADAFIKFADENAILLRGDRTLYGIDEIKKYFNERRDAKGTLYWIPSKAEVSGNIGYTFGEWKFFIKDSSNSDTTYGNYISIWKKQTDGSWKYVLDGGNSNQLKNKNQQ